MHGGIQPEIAQTWLGIVGPGVKAGGIDDTTWTDHTDVRPTMLALLGLEDDYTHDGRVPSLEKAADMEVYYRGLATGEPLQVTSSQKADLVVFLRTL